MISLTTEYALRAVVFLAQHPNLPQTNRVIAHATHVPVSYLAKVMHALVRSHIVRAQRGSNGGFQLTSSPAAVTVFDVVTAVDPFKRIRHCPLNLPEHADQLCALHQQLDNAIASAEGQLRFLTIADLLERKEPSGACCSTETRANCGGDRRAI